MDTRFWVEGHEFNIDEQVPFDTSLDVIFEDNRAGLYFNGMFMRGGYWERDREFIGYLSVTSSETLLAIERRLNLVDITRRWLETYHNGDRPKMFFCIKSDLDVKRHYLGRISKEAGRNLIDLICKDEREH